MNYRGIGVVAFLTAVMGLAVAVVSLLPHLPPHQPIPSSADLLVPVSLAFLAISALASMAGATLRAQAAEIAELRRQLADRQGGH